MRQHIPVPQDEGREEVTNGTPPSRSPCIDSRLPCVLRFALTVPFWGSTWAVVHATAFSFLTRPWLSTRRTPAPADALSSRASRRPSRAPSGSDDGSTHPPRYRTPSVHRRPPPAQIRDEPPGPRA